MSMMGSELAVPRTLLLRAAVISQPGRVELRAAEVPEPGPHEVRIRLEGSGVCGSNLPVWEGRPWFDYPLAAGAPGHEGWGTIDAVGDDVPELRVGQRVAALSQHAYATHDVTSAADVVPLPPSLDGAPFPGEPLGCAMNVFRRAGIERGHTVAIVGIGFLGALLTQLCERAGARVIAVSRRPFALDVARSCGAHEIIALNDAAAAGRSIEHLTGGELCERVIECAGVQETLDLAAAATAVHGRLIIAGYHQDGTRTVDMQAWNWRGIDVINAHERDPRQYVAGMRAAVEAVVNGILDPAPLYTHEFALEDTAQALEMMRSRPDGFLKALVRT